MGGRRAAWLTAAALVGGLLGAVAGPTAATAGAPTAAGVFTFYDLPDGITSDAMAFTPDGTLWFLDGTATFADAIVEYDTAGQQVIERHEILGDLADLAVDGGGNVWFADRSGNFGAGSGYLDPDTGTVVRLEDPFSLDGDPIESDVVAAAPNGVVLNNGSNHSGLWEATTAGLAIEDFKGTDGRAIRSMALGPDGDMWLQLHPPVTEGPTRLAHFTPGSDSEVTLLTADPSLFNVDPGALISGPGGRIWYSLGVNGTYRIATTATAMTQATHFNHLRTPRAMVEGVDGNVWFVDPSGLNGTVRLGRTTPTGSTAVYGHAQLTEANAIAAHPTTGDLWIADGDQLAHFVPTPVRTCASRTVTVDLAYASSRQEQDDVILGTAAADTIRAGQGVDTVCGANGNDRLVDQDPFNATQVDRFYGQNGNDTLTGAFGNDTLDGGPGTDTLNGGYGKDRLIGGTQRDICNGGPDADTQAGCEVRSAIP